jgi:hypothetical protein
MKILIADEVHLGLGHVVFGLGVDLVQALSLFEIELVLFHRPGRDLPVALRLEARSTIHNSIKDERRAWDPGFSQGFPRRFRPRRFSSEPLPDIIVDPEDASACSF